MKETEGSPTGRTMHPRLSLRSAFAVRVGRLAGALSRALGRGAGGMFGGKIALKISPRLLAELSQGRRITLVSGTNGKSTTTALTAAAMREVGEVATNSRGDNMTTGIVSALMSAPRAPYAVLEVDEMYLPQIAKATTPAAIILLNLSRDQLDRVGEIGAVENRLRQAVELSPQAKVVANCDDPLVASAAWGAPGLVWVAAGAPWDADAVTFPRTGGIVVRTAGGWEVLGGQALERPIPLWEIGPVGADDTFTIFGPDCEIVTRLSLPGRANRGNAAQAAAAAYGLGVPAGAIARALPTVSAVAGRYKSVNVGEHSVRTLLAKNPAGWQESLTMLAPGTSQLVIAVNAQVPDGVDTSWLWDVPFEKLSEMGLTRIVASGERAADLATRLEYAGIDSTFVQDPLAAIASCDPGAVDVVANYTAFRDLTKQLESS